jgi:hypothetical protein
VKARRPSVGADTSTIIIAVYGNNVAYPMSGLVRNPGPGTVYLGEEGVTTSTGFPLQINESLTLDLVNEGVYAVATVTTTIYVLRRGD